MTPASTIHSRISEESKKVSNIEGLRKEKAISIAFGEGAKYGIASFIAGGLATLYGLKYSPSYNKYTGPSGKMAMPLMLGK